MKRPSLSVEEISYVMFETLADTFPITCASDEFFYFPQVQPSKPKWSNWDRYCSDTIHNITRQLSAWERDLGQLISPQLELATQIDISLLMKLAHTIKEQLSEIKTWEFQPTFYLTLVGIGLAEAIGSNDPEAKHLRARNLTYFLEQASYNLSNVPVLFRDMGLDMAKNVKKYLMSLLKELPELQSALITLNRFTDMLQKESTCQDFLLPQDLLEHVVRFHLNCDMDLIEINEVLDQEIAEMKQILKQENIRSSSRYTDAQDLNLSWPEVLQSIPLPTIGREGLVKLYKEEIEKLSKHCLERGLVSTRLISSCPVHVAVIPQFLSTIRTASSYSISVRHPPSGGTFYLLSNRIMNEAQRQSLRQFRMTCAHETYPGHHLLDATRLNLRKPVRRAVEQPIFCEGWACFAEELMRLTGYFSNHSDRLLLAQRRIIHALRGKIDLGLQTGRMNILEAACCLEEIGISKQQAISLAHKYPLNPGYQLCYTLGLHRFLDLFARYNNNNIPNYLKKVLSQGEINFIDLEKTLEDHR